MWRLEDPASRDQDRRVPRRGRFDERVRRTWFQVSQTDIEACRGMEELAAMVCRRTGEDTAQVRGRLEWFARLEDEGAPARRDRMVRPGASADAPTPRVRRP